MKKSQIQMVETIVVLFIFFIIILFGFIFYSKLSTTALEVKKEENLQLKAIELAQTVLTLPELQCSTAGIPSENCIDYYKLIFSGPVIKLHAEDYYDILGYSTIQVEEIYPDPFYNSVLYIDCDNIIPFDIIEDKSKNNNDGTLKNGANLDPNGKYGQACNFDGANDYIEISNNDILNFGSSTDFTIEAWIKTDRDGKIISKVDVNGIGYRCTVDTSKFHCEISDGTNTASFSSNNNVINDWHHVVAVFDRDRSGQTYVDGTLDGASTISTIGNIDNNKNLHIGESTVVPPNRFRGLIDDIKIFDRVLSPTEIELHSQNPPGIITLYNRTLTEYSDIATTNLPVKLFNDGEIVDKTFSKKISSFGMLTINMYIK